MVIRGLAYERINCGIITWAILIDILLVMLRQEYVTSIPHLPRPEQQTHATFVTMELLG